MKEEFADALRKAIAVQVAILEFHDSDINDRTAIEAINLTEKALIKALKKVRNLV